MIFVRQLITAHQFRVSIVEGVRMWETLLSALVLVNGLTTVVTLVIIVIAVLVSITESVYIYREDLFAHVMMDGEESNVNMI